MILCASFLFSFYLSFFLQIKAKYFNSNVRCSVTATCLSLYIQPTDMAIFSLRFWLCIHLSFFYSYCWSLSVVLFYQIHFILFFSFKNVIVSSYSLISLTHNCTIIVTMIKHKVREINKEANRTERARESIEYCTVCIVFWMLSNVQLQSNNTVSPYQRTALFCYA